MFIDTHFHRKKHANGLVLVKVNLDRPIHPSAPRNELYRCVGARGFDFLAVFGLKVVSLEADSLCGKK